MRLLASGEKPREAVLVLPLSKLLVRVVRVPEEFSDAPAEYVRPMLQTMNPFPDEELTVSCETVGTTASGMVVIAAAFPEGASSDVADELDRLKLGVTGIDVLELGEIRRLWNEIAVDSSRKLVLIHGADGVALFVMQNGEPCVIRSISPQCDLKRELTLSLMEAEDFGGACGLSEIVLVWRMVGEGVEASAGWKNELSAFAPVRILEVADEDEALRGAAERAEEPGTLNALPRSWADVLDETRFKRKLGRCLAVAVGLWALVMATLFCVPMVYGFLADRQNEKCRRHSRQYREVKSTKEKFELVQKYRDHSLGALEIMKAISDALPLSGIELGHWNYKRGEGVNVSGEADSAELVFDFKDAVAAVSLVTEDGGDPSETLFKTVSLKGPTARGTKQRFDLECGFKSGEEEE